MYIYIYIHLHIHTYTCTHKCAYKYRCTQTYMHACVSTCTFQTSKCSSNSEHISELLELTKQLMTCSAYFAFCVVSHLIESVSVASAAKFPEIRSRP